jgi:hypothetical protein
MGNMAERSLQEKQISVQADLNYVIRTGEPLYNYYLAPPPAGKPASNEVVEPHRVSITSLRDANEPFRLDIQGVELVSFTTSVKDIYDPAELNTVFNAEVADLVKRHTGAAEVRVFSPFLRGEEARRRMPGSITAPAGIIHVDYTHESGPSRFAQVFGADAERFRGRRFAIINVWRPITGPMQDHPLAICDARTVAPDDLLPSKTFSLVDEHGLHSADGHIEEACVYSVAFDPAHRWYYARDMMPHEALLLKNYDSELSGVSRFSPHTAFDDPTTPANALPRASIEVRSIAVW